MELSKPFSEKHSSKIELNDQGLVSFVKVNTQETLTDQQLDDLMDLSVEYNLRMQIGRSGAGIKIEFKLNND